MNIYLEKIAEAKKTKAKLPNHKDVPLSHAAEGGAHGANIGGGMGVISAIAHGRKGIGKGIRTALSGALGGAVVGGTIGSMIPKRLGEGYTAKQKANFKTVANNAAVGSGIGTLVGLGPLGTYGGHHMGKSLGKDKIHLNSKKK